MTEENIDEKIELLTQDRDQLLKAAQAAYYVLSAKQSGLIFGLNGQEQDALFLLKKAGANR